MVAPAAQAQEPAADAPAATGTTVPNPSGLPIPRFVSLRTGEINLRTGPGVRYPVEWVYRRESLPVEITAEYDTWRRVRDIEGAEGWVHQSMLSGRRSILVLGTKGTQPNDPASAQPIYKAANSQAALVARVEPGAQGELLNCESAWCEVRFKAADVKGYMPKGTFYGAYETETLK